LERTISIKFATSLRYLDPDRSITGPPENTLTSSEDSSSPSDSTPSTTP
jgi:hypothetical protein